MSVSFVAAGSVASGSGSTLVITVPTCAVGDVLILAWLDPDGRTFTGPSGWTAMGSTPSSYGNGLWKTAVSGDSGSTVTLTATASTTYARAVIVAYRGVVGTPTFHDAGYGSSPAAVPAGSCVVAVGADAVSDQRAGTVPYVATGANLRAEATAEAGGYYQYGAMAVGDWLPGSTHTSGPLDGSTYPARSYVAWISLPGVTDDSAGNLLLG